MTRSHPIIGHRFSTLPGNAYVVTHWTGNGGFWVKLLFGKDGSRSAGDVACISERAIGRTYHPIRETDPRYASPLEGHDKNCECVTCGT